MTDVSDSGRSVVLGELRRELFGPPIDSSPLGSALDLSQELHFLDKADAYGPFFDAETGEEILTRDLPTRRYGVGVLFPRNTRAVDVREEASETQLAFEEEPSDNEQPGDIAAIGQNPIGAADDADDFDLSATGELRPSSMAVSFLADLDCGDVIRLKISGACYRSFKVTVAGDEREWFVRRSLAAEVDFDIPEGREIVRKQVGQAVEPIDLTATLVSRPHGPLTLCTVAVDNSAVDGVNKETASLFQSRITVVVIRNGEEISGIVPYPDAQAEELMKRDEEARSLDLLYRNAPTFGIGHGCAATWDEDWGAQRCSELHGDALPSFEAPSVTPDVVLSDGMPIEVPMGPLAGLDEKNDGFGSLWKVVESYGKWIDERRHDAELLTDFRFQAAGDHLAKCERMHERMVSGIRWLEENETARRAFVLANRAMLYQQLHYRSESRRTEITTDDVVVEPAEPIPSWQQANRRWRAFQIGFLLAGLRSASLGGDEDRETVDLIFFPTGGGKTEAYLGLSAFTLFYQRLTGESAGVSVLMRYTLRLLTTQQLIRAAALICAMERVRVEENLEVEPFSIGIWVGGSTTPNTRSQALSDFSRLARDGKENPFLILRCPWCAAQMGPVAVAKGVKGRQPKVAGYRSSNGTVKFRCPDRKCEFQSGLPIYVIDEDVYEYRPSIVIGTVDKFAQLTFKPEAKSLFGLNKSGEREGSPPNLIIQDELHLISGPLGSMVGLYEGVIEDLCTQTKDGSVIKPKIVGSTATIRNYAEQIRGLYGRTSSALFPPHGLCASDSFFAQHARDAGTGKLLQGRLYVGVHAPSLGSLQTAQVRTGAALLQAARELPDELKDPWWTSMMFFNSLRELGSSVSLLQQDIPDYLFTKKLRDGSEDQRFVNNLMELTSRLRQDEIPEAISRLETKASSPAAVDVCLASNIIEVGIDIPRLSLLTVLSQPKSTSQYIQITGRVGRNWQERPGLVVTIYAATRPRDRSHFEKFQSYHQRLYASVEPVSVTPFATPVLRRGLHAAVVAFIRQHGANSTQPSPIPDVLIDEVEAILVGRAKLADPESVQVIQREMKKRRAEWKGWEPENWLVDSGNSEGALMRRAGEWVQTDVAEMTWEAPTSMRDVDAECRFSITNRYATMRGEIDGEDSE